MKILIIIITMMILMMMKIIMIMIIILIIILIILIMIIKIVIVITRLIDSEVPNYNKLSIKALDNGASADFTKNKAGYTATSVACGWAGAVFEVT